MSKNAIQACALTCEGISKVFPIYDETERWRLLFGMTTHEKMVTAIDNISLTVPKGRFVGILGRNGAGKSTLLRTLGGVYSPTLGKVQVNGHLSGLFELGGFGHRYITGREYAARILTLRGVKKNNLDKLIEGIIDFSELEEHFDAPLNTYSSGMAARLFFSTATALQYEVYLIDEILSVGDEHFQAKCWHRLRERFAQGASGVLVTHDWSAVIKLCEEAHIMERGKIINSGPADKVVCDYLNLPMPEKAKAKFSDDLSSTYEVHAGEDTRLLIPIEVMENRPVEFSFTVELLRLGIGWDILMLNHCGIVATQEGHYMLAVDIPKLPLSPGKYSLNLFLNFPAQNNSPKTGADIRSWTTGNGIELIVNGSATKGTFILPFTMTIRD